MKIISESQCDICGQINRKYWDGDILECGCVEDVEIPGIQCFECGEDNSITRSYNSLTNEYTDYCHYCGVTRENTGG